MVALTLEGSLTPQVLEMLTVHLHALSLGNEDSRQSFLATIDDVNQGKYGLKNFNNHFRNEILEIL